MPKGPSKTPKGTRSHNQNNPNFPFKRSAKLRHGHHPTIPISSYSRDRLASDDRISQDVPPQRIDMKIIAHRVKETKKIIREMEEKYPGITSFNKQTSKLTVNEILKLQFWQMDAEKRQGLLEHYRNLARRERELARKLDKIRFDLRRKRFRSK